MKLYNLESLLRRVPIYPFWEMMLDMITMLSVFVAVIAVVSSFWSTSSSLAADFRTISVLFLIASLTGVLRYLQRERRMWNLPDVTFRDLVARVINNHGSVLLLVDLGCTSAMRRRIVQMLEKWGMVVIDGESVKMRNHQIGDQVAPIPENEKNFFGERGVKYLLRVTTSTLGEYKVRLVLEAEGGRVVSTVCGKTVEDAVKKLLNCVALDVRVRLDS